MRYIKIITIVVCLFLSTNTKIFSQGKFSLYTGGGTCTNLGGIFGVGGEIKYKSYSFSTAIGPGLNITEHDYNYDVGVKLYSKYSFFGGVNYGFIRTIGPLLDSNKKDCYAFTFTIGYRGGIYKHFYYMGYLGATSDYLSFMSKEKRELALIPRIGFIIGYDF